jgi:hypothetical protein
MLIPGGEAVAALPVTDPLGRDVDERLAGCEGWPARRQLPDASVQDADEHVFRWEGAVSVVAQPAQVPGDDAQEPLQKFERSFVLSKADDGRAAGEWARGPDTILAVVAKSDTLSELRGPNRRSARRMLRMRLNTASFRVVPKGSPRQSPAA